MLNKKKKEIITIIFKKYILKNHPTLQIDDVDMK